ncbi:hypothetical protein N656DRAFT_328176 [Canariomyces notabilis]|uniref:Uncharacterized protein n=1 Tax=Canariomyces notabilis TaxID=2074819 RepID=A0AAN6T8X8_9PEZI|nr:hypothetical protein N656DRAFT_328176 [Canariomyces arenarius]
MDWLFPSPLSALISSTLAQSIPPAQQLLRTSLLSAPDVNSEVAPGLFIACFWSPIPRHPTDQQLNLSYPQGCPLAASGPPSAGLDVSWPNAEPRRAMARKLPSSLTCHRGKPAAPAQRVLRYHSLDDALFCLASSLELLSLIRSSLVVNIELGHRLMRSVRPAWFAVHLILLSTKVGHGANLRHLRLLLYTLT